MEGMVEENANLALISAKSRRQAMDWSLVLASQGIEPVIERDDRGWCLLVSVSEENFARRAIEQYQRENKGWRWRHPTALPGGAFHWGVLFWTALVIAFQFLVVRGHDPFLSAGAMDNLAVRAGEWWRLFTAVWIHADGGHLASNLSIGIILVGLAMGRWGAGISLVAIFLAGAAGNLLGLAVQHEHYRGLGASGMVMGALGLLAASALIRVRTLRDSAHARRNAIAGLMAGSLLFVLLGFEPHADIYAHAGGFVAGTIFGGILNLLPRRMLGNPTLNVFAGMLLSVSVIWTWQLALASR